MSALRGGLLRGRAVALAGGVPPEVTEALHALGASTAELAHDPEQPGAWAAAQPALHGLLFAAGEAFGAGGQPGLMAVLEAAWAAVLELATALIAGQRAGKIILLAPPPDAGPLAAASRDALENLARTLSIEWARHGITSCALTPGAASTGEEVAELVAYLLSPAGDYFTGCRLSLGAVTPPQREASSAQGTMTASS